MKKLILLSFLLIPAFSFAQDEAAPAPDAATAVAADIDTNKDGKVSADETEKLIDKDETVNDVASGVGDVVDAAQGLKGKKGTELAVAISVLLAAIFKMLLSLVKVLSKTTNWFATKKGKLTLKYMTLGLGVLAAVGAGITSSLGAGFGWVEILIIGLSGPGSVAAHELSFLIPGVNKKKEEPKAEEPKEG